MEKQITELEEDQKKSEELILRLSTALKKANERNENLQKKLDQALKLQNDSHETICGILEKKMEEIELKHQEFIKSMGEIMSKTVEGFETSQNLLEKKMNESEDLLVNTATEVALLKISLNEHQRKILWEMKQQTMALDLTANATVISTEEETAPEDEAQKLEEDRSESLDAPEPSVEKKKKKKKGSKKTAQQEKSVKSITEAVLDRTLVDSFAWARRKVTVTEDGRVQVIEADFPSFPLEMFINFMKTMPLMAFNGCSFEIECQSCKKNFIINAIIPDGISAVCNYCKELTIVAALPQPGKKYLKCACSHALLIQADQPKPPCKFCKRTQYSDANHLARTPIPAAHTPEKRMDKLLNLPHLEWTKPHVSTVGDNKVRVKCCLLSPCEKVSILSEDGFTLQILVCTWRLIPSEFEVDCWNCKKIISLHGLNDDRISVKCNNCKETTIIVTGNVEARPNRVIQFSCGHYEGIVSEEQQKTCYVCKRGQPKTVPNKKQRVPWKKGQTKEWTWPDFLKDFQG